MKLEKKLDGFMQIAINEAKEQTDRELSEVEAQYNADINEYRHSAAEAAKKRLREEYLSYSRERNREVTELAARGKRELLALRAKLLEGVFEDVLKRLYDYVKTPEYAEFLREDIRIAGKGAEVAIVYLMPRDAEILAGGKVIQGKITYEITNEDFIGGFKMKRDEHMLIDNTYKTKYDDALRNTNIFRIE